MPHGFFYIHGGDTPMVKVTFSFFILKYDGSLTWLIGGNKMANMGLVCIRYVDIASYSEIYTMFGRVLSYGKMLFDPDITTITVRLLLEK
ncbi:hypothetical protein [Serratia marcescens]|uniref:hypothetical protein n=1 Tax=Serratia marcescens TaxID=615 RepID=UPI0038968921